MIYIIIKILYNVLIISENYGLKPKIKNHLNYMI